MKMTLLILFCILFSRCCFSQEIVNECTTDSIYPTIICVPENDTLICIDLPESNMDVLIKGIATYNLFFEIEADSLKIRNFDLQWIRLYDLSSNDIIYNYGLSSSQSTLTLVLLFELLKPKIESVFIHYHCSELHNAKCENKEYATKLTIPFYIRL